MKFISLAIFVKKTSKNYLDLWMQVREEDGPLKGFWEFPGGNIENNETPLNAVIREVKEEVDIDIKAENIRTFNNFSFNVYGKRVEFFSFLVKDAIPKKGQWFSIALNNYQESLPEKIPPANFDLIKELCHAFKNVEPQDFDLLWTK